MPIQTRRLLHSFSSLLLTNRLFGLAFILFLFGSSCWNIVDPDFWWHLRTGEHIVKTGTIPHTDLFSFTSAGKEWVTHEWLSEIIIFVIYESLGYGGLIVTFALIITIALSIAYLRCEGHPIVNVGALFVGAVASMVSWGVRPQMFTFLFASIYIAVLGHYVQYGNRRTLWGLVPIMILWVNLHGGFALGLGLIGLFAAGLTLDGLAGIESRRHIWRKVSPMVLVFILCALGVLINPNGARMYSYPYETLTSRAMQIYITEWHSPDFHGIKYLAMASLLFLTLSAMALSKETVRLGEALLLAALGYLSLRSARNIPFFALAAIPLLAKHAWSCFKEYGWERLLSPPEKRKTGAQAVRNVVLLLIAVVFAVMRPVQAAKMQSLEEAKAFPIAAVDYIRSQRPPEPLYNSYNWGGYLIWSLYPDYPVYMDGRADVHGDELMHQFFKTSRGRNGWREPLNTYGVNTVLIEPDSPLASLLREDDAWTKVFEDDQAVIFTKR